MNQTDFFFMNKEFITSSQLCIVKRNTMHNEKSVKIPDVRFRS